MKTLALITLFLSYISANALTEVANTVSPVRTRTGCTVTLTCGGNGTDIGWTQFGRPGQLEITEYQNVTTVTYEFNNTDHSYFVSEVTLIVSPDLDRKRYTCAVFGERTITHTISIRVDPEIVTIENIDNTNISDYHINEKVTLFCPVQTCAENTRVQFILGDQEVGSGVSDVLSDAMTVVYSLVLDVTHDTIGEYLCKVDTVNPNATAMRAFSVTGTPLPAIPTQPPPTVTTDEPDTGTPDNNNNNNNNNNNTNNNNNNGGGDDGDSSLSVVFAPVSLFLLLTVSVLFSL